MKRRIKGGINRFRSRVSKMEKEEKIGFAIAVVTGILAGIICWGMRDTSPATAFDYEPLEKQVIAIQKNPDILFSTDCSIEINDEVITVKLENDECMLIAQFDQNFEVVSTSKKDNCMLLDAFVLSLLIGLTVFVYSAFIWFVVLNEVSKKFKSKKSN